MCKPYDIVNCDLHHQITRQKPDHTAKTGSHSKNQVTRNKLGIKRDLQALNGGPGYGVTVLLGLRVELKTKSSQVEHFQTKS